MSIFNACFNRRGLYLSEDEEEDEESVCCCFNKRQEGRIHLPHKRTIDDYLDPRSPVNIEALLAEEELDLYNNEEEEEQVQAGSSKFNPLTLNHISPFFDEEDAQFISEHRISAILVERPKLSSAHALKEENVIQQELMDFITPKPSNSSTSVISSRRFAFKEQTSTQELTDFTPIPEPTSLIPTDTHTQFPVTTLSRTPAPSTSTTKPPRRPSVTSVLGDKLDDFTGKLALIKKNIQDHER